jgi:hypothetical protein
VEGYDCLYIIDSLRFNLILEWFCQVNEHEPVDQEQNDNLEDELEDELE